MRSREYRNQDGVSVADSREVEDLEWYEFDPYAPRPQDNGLSAVELHDVDIDNEDDVITF